MPTTTHLGLRPCTQARIEKLRSTVAAIPNATFTPAHTAEGQPCMSVVVAGNTYRIVGRAGKVAVDSAVRSSMSLAALERIVADAADRAGVGHHLSCICTSCNTYW